MAVRRAILMSALLLAGCDSGEQGTSFTFKSDEKGETVTASADGETGRVAIDAPGFKADIKLPRIELDSESLDIDGVRLFPGSTVEGVDIADDTGPGDGTVRIRFSAPGGEPEVRAWFDEQMRAEGFSLGADGMSGRTREGEPFRLELTPSGGTTDGVFTLGG